MLRLQELVSRSESQGMLGDAVYEVLRTCIIEGSLKPGSPIRIDRLAKEIGVSRTPVREAVRRLEAENFITTNSRQGLVVKGLSEQDLVEIFQIREALEAQAARLATFNLSPRDFSHLEQLLEAMQETVTTDLSRFRQLTGEFYRHIAQASRNGRLLAMILELQDRVRQFGGSTLYIPGKAEETLQELRTLLAAFRRQDADAAEAIVRAHRRRTLETRLLTAVD